MGRVYRDEVVIKKVGERIKIALKANKITHLEFQMHTGLSASRITSGDLNMTISTLQKIADFIHIPVDELIK